MKAKILISKEDMCEMVKTMLEEKGIKVEKVETDVTQNYDECYFNGISATVDLKDLK